MFPFRTLALAFWSAVVDPHLVPSDSSSQKSVIFVMMAVQEALADCQMVVLVLSCELFWNPPCTNFMKPKSFSHDPMDRTMIDERILHQVIDSYVSFILIVHHW
jgi:hypothetical protein